MNSKALFLFSLLLFAYVCGARKEPAGELWKTVMGEEAMPKAIQDLLNVESTSNTNTNTDTKRDHFVRDFDVKANVIIYHSRLHDVDDHAHSEKQKPSDVEG